MILPFALIFTIALAIILILGAIIIWRSDLPAKDKLNSLLLIMALFAAVSIVNEVKRSRNIGVRQPLLTGDFEKVFYSTPSLLSDAQSALPHLHHDRNLIADSLLEWSPANSSSLSLALLYSEKNSGASSAAKTLTANLQSERHPVLYVDLRHPEFTLIDFLAALKVPSTEAVDKAVGKLNEDGKVPTIIVDNAENALVHDETPINGLVCHICRYLVTLYDTHKVAVIMLTSDARARDLIKSDYNLISKISFYDLKATDFPNLVSYLGEKVNEKIIDEPKRFKLENIRKLHDTLGWNYGLAEEYLSNLVQYSSVNEFVDRKVQTEAKRIAGYTDLWDLLNSLLTLTEAKRDNDWISYAQIRKVYEGNPARKLDDALNADILVKENNLYRFTNAAVYNAALTARENKLRK